jgi:hypothetical protein
VRLASPPLPALPFNRLGAGAGKQRAGKQRAPPRGEEFEKALRLAGSPSPFSLHLSLSLSLSLQSQLSAPLLPSSFLHATKLIFTHGLFSLAYQVEKISATLTSEHSFAGGSFCLGRKRIVRLYEGVIMSFSRFNDLPPLLSSADLAAGRPSPARKKLAHLQPSKEVEAGEREARCTTTYMCVAKL